MKKLAGVLIAVVLFGIALAWWADGHAQRKQSFTVTNNTPNEESVVTTDGSPHVVAGTASDSIYIYRAGDLSKEALIEIRKIVREEMDRDKLKTAVAPPVYKCTPDMQIAHCMVNINKALMHQTTVDNQNYLKPPTITEPQ